MGQNILHPSAVAIALLADHLDTIPTLARWFKRQSPDHYAEHTLADIEQEFQREANRDVVPVRLVAFADGSLAGTIVLRERALATHPEYTPGLGGLYVVEPFRGRGIGSALVRAGMAVARGYGVVYTATAVAGSMLERLGWHRIESIPHGEEQLSAYRCAFGETR